MTTMEMAKKAFASRHAVDSWFKDAAPNFEAFAEMVRKEEREACSEHEELVKIALELREILLDDASDVMQGAMVGCPVECVAFAKWWIQRAKGIQFDDPFNGCAFRR